MFLLFIILNYLLTALGSSFVFFMKKTNKKVIASALGTSAGIMIAASFFSLILPAMNLLENYSKICLLFIPFGFFLGVMFLYICDKFLPHEHMLSKDKEGLISSLSQKNLLMLAMTLHNIPEGFAVGVAFASVTNNPLPAIILSIGIGIQNIPEGIAISLPMHTKGNSKKKAFLFGQYSGLIEIPSAIIGYLCASLISNILPIALSFAAGSMLFVCVEELIPEATHENTIDVGALSCMIGFIIMMILDITLS